jgi:hypothetical protein
MFSVSEIVSLCCTFLTDKLQPENSIGELDNYLVALIIQPLVDICTQTDTCRGDMCIINKKIQVCKVIMGALLIQCD